MNQRQGLPRYCGRYWRIISFPNSPAAAGLAVGKRTDT
jgi:hypothetical protein